MSKFHFNFPIVFDPKYRINDYELCVMMEQIKFESTVKSPIPNILTVPIISKPLFEMDRIIIKSEDHIMLDKINEAVFGQQL